MLQHPLAKRVGVVDGQLAYGVKRPARVGHSHPLDVSQPLHEGVPPGHVAVAHLLEVRLGGFQGGFGRDLGQRGGREPGHGKLHGRLAHRGVFGHHGTNARTTHAVTLGHAVDQDDVLLQPGQLKHRFGLGPVVAKFSVHLVGKEVQVVVTHQLRQGVQRLRGVDRPCGVAGVAQQDGLRLVVDFGGEIGDGRQGEPVFNPRRHRHNLHPCHLGEAVVVGVKWLRHDHLVAWIQARHEREHQSFRPSCGDQNVVGLHVQPRALVVRGKPVAV